jgi:hypothetical protein
MSVFPTSIEITHTNDAIRVSAATTPPLPRPTVRTRSCAPLSRFAWAESPASFPCGDSLIRVPI